MARRYCETFNAGGLDGTQHLRHPQMEVHDPPNFPDADRYVGEAAVRQIVESYLALGWDGQFRVEEYLDAGEEVVVIWQARFRTAHGEAFQWIKRSLTCTSSRAERCAGSGST